MSNYQLKAEVNKLQAQLHELERENNQLKSEIHSTVNSVNRAEQNLSEYNQRMRSSLDQATAEIDSSINRALSAYELQGKIDQLYTRYKCIELSNKKIRSLNNKKYYDFNNYRTVRKIVKGMMDNLDLNLVSENVLYKSIEKQHLLTPDYWLTSALISIMAWKNDDKLLADRALESAFKLDAKNSSIFYMIFNMRMDRHAAAVKWFLEYQKCEFNGSDEHTFLLLFSLISKTLSDQVDDETAQMISDFIHALIIRRAEKEGYSEEGIAAVIAEHMQSLVTLETYELPLLAKYCSDYGEIAKMLNLAGNNYNILEFILRIVNVPIAERNAYLKEYLNELLEKPNDIEMDSYHEIEYHELVIKMAGNVEEAKKRFKEELEKRESEFDIISNIIEWVYDFSNKDVNGQMRLNMFTLIKSFQEKAAETYFSCYRAMFRTIHPVTILDYATDADFSDEAGEISKVENFYAKQQNQELARIKNILAYVLLGVGLACGAAAFFINLSLLAGLGIGFAMGLGILISNKCKRKNIILKAQKQKENVIGIVNQLFDEHRKMKQLYQGFDDVSVKIREELAKL